MCFQLTDHEGRNGGKKDAQEAADDPTNDLIKRRSTTEERARTVV
jgi:hypothetical protein